MMRNRLLSGLVLAVLACAVVPAWAADWKYVGSSDFTIPPANVSALMRDKDFIRYNSVVVDNAGNIFATAVNDNNTGTSGGLTIFAPGGAKIAVDLNAAGFQGGITKLVKAGDGKIYGLQNWMNTAKDNTARGINRIIRIGADGIVELIWSPGALLNGNRLGGMAVGGDGNVYWTTNSEDETSTPPYGWKYRFFFRYNVGTGVVEESPMNPNILPDPPYATNNGLKQRHRMFDLEYVGGDVFCVVGHDFNSGSSDGTWAADPMGWDKARTPMDPVFCPNNFSNPLTGVRGVTATVYDSARRKLWIGARAVDGNKPWNIGSQVTATVVPLDGANKGVQVYKRVNKANSYYSKNAINPTSTTPHISMVSLAAKFRVDSITPAAGVAFSATILKAATDTNKSPETKPEVGIKIVETGVGTGTYRYKLWDTVGNVAILDIAPVVMGNWETCYIFIDGTGHTGDAIDLHTVQCWWNDLNVFDQEYTANGSDDSGTAQFGAVCETTGDGSTDYVTFDWVGVAPWKVTPNEGSWPVGVTPPDDPDNGFTSPDHGHWFTNCSYVPDLLGSTAIMTRFTGADGAPGLFPATYDGVPVAGDSDACVGAMAHWHVNGHDPRANTDQIANNGYYWVSTLAVNPLNGAGWMSWGAQATYDYAGTYGPLGSVYAVGSDDAGPGWSEGVPQAAHTDPAKAADASMVVALTFGTKYAYAVTCDLVTGEYNLFRAPNGTCHTPPQDTDNDGDVDLTDFGTFQSCFNGPNRAWPASLPAGLCTCLDQDDDGDVDLTDFGTFQSCFNGPNRPAACR